MRATRRAAAVVLVLALLAATPGRTHADEAESSHPVVAAGERVRLFSWTPGRKQWTGRVVSATDSSLVLQPDGIDEEPVGLLWPDVSGVEVSRGTYGHPGTGAIVGGLITLPVAGLLIGLSNFDCQSRCHDVTGPIVATTIVGVGVGALVGLAARSDRWQAAPRTPQISLGIAPVPRGAGATLAVRF